MRQQGPLAEMVVQHHGERPGQPARTLGSKMPVISLPHPRLLVTALLLCPLSDLHPDTCVCVCVCVRERERYSQSLVLNLPRSQPEHLPHSFHKHLPSILSVSGSVLTMRPQLTRQWEWAPEDPPLWYQLLCIFPKGSGAPWVPSLEKQRQRSESQESELENPEPSACPHSSWLALRPLQSSALSSFVAAAWAGGDAGTPHALPVGQCCGHSGTHSQR